MQHLQINMYGNVLPGGYVLVDNYQTTACGGAVDTFRRLADVTDAIEHINSVDIYWRRPLKAVQSHQYDKDNVRQAMITRALLKSADQ